MFEQYISTFCKEYSELGYKQLPMVMAVAKDVKPLMDDFIKYAHLPIIKKMCEKYGLILEMDNYMAIAPTPEYIREVEKKQYLTTTKVIGVPFNPLLKEAIVKIYISKSKKIIEETRKHCWYNLIINGRAVYTEIIDHIRFARMLGFPECCISFFKGHNREGLNTPVEIWKNTKGEPSFYCNNFMMDHTFFLIHHHPCSFNCKNTINLAKKVLNAVKEEDNEFARKIEDHLKLPMLVFGEKKAIVFDGEKNGNSISYSKLYFTGDLADLEQYKAIKQGNKIKIKDDIIEIFDENTYIDSIRRNNDYDGMIMRFN